MFKKSSPLLVSFLAAILDFGDHIEIIKIMYSSRIGYLFKKQTFWHITRLCKLIISPVMFVLRFLVAILDFGDHIEIIKIIYSSQIRYLLKQRTFWHITRLCKSIISPVMFGLAVFWRPSWFFGHHFFLIHILMSDCFLFYCRHIVLSKKNHLH